MKDENKTNTYKKRIIFFAVAIVLLIGLFFQFRPLFQEYNNKKKVKLKYEEMIQFTTDNSDAIMKVSEVLINNIDFIKENRDFNLEKLRLILDDDEKKIFDIVLSRITYDAVYHSNDRSTEEVNYICDIIDRIDIILIYYSEDILDIQSVYAFNKATKIGGHLYVVLREKFYE